MVLVVPSGSTCTKPMEGKAPWCGCPALGPQGHTRWFCFFTVNVTLLIRASLPCEASAYPSYSQATQYPRDNQPESRLLLSCRQMTSPAHYSQHSGSCPHQLCIFVSVALHPEVESLIVTGLVTFYHTLSFLAGRALLNGHTLTWG